MKRIKIPLILSAIFSIWISIYLLNHQTQQADKFSAVITDIPTQKWDQTNKWFSHFNDKQVSCNLKGHKHQIIDNVHYVDNLVAVAYDISNFKGCFKQIQTSLGQTLIIIDKCGACSKDKHLDIWTNIPSNKFGIPIKKTKYSNLKFDYKIKD